MKKALLMLAWTVGAFFGSATILGFLFGIVLFCMVQVHYDATPHIPLAVTLAGTIPALVAVVFFFLAFRGRLPGTGK